MSDIFHETCIILNEEEHSRKSSTTMSACWPQGFPLWYLLLWKITTKQSVAQMMKRREIFIYRSSLCGEIAIKLGREFLFPDFRPVVARNRAMKQEEIHLELRGWKSSNLLADLKSEAAPSILTPEVCFLTEAGGLSLHDIWSLWTGRSFREWASQMKQQRPRRQPAAHWFPVPSSTHAPLCTSLLFHHQTPSTQLDACPLTCSPLNYEVSCEQSRLADAIFKEIQPWWDLVEGTCKERTWGNEKETAKRISCEAPLIHSFLHSFSLSFVLFFKEHFGVDLPYVNLLILSLKWESKSF